MTPEDFKFHTWAMGWIHAFLVDQQQSEMRHADRDQGDYYGALLIETGFDSDCVIANVKTATVDRTYVLESR